MSEARIHRWHVPDEAEGERLDRHVAERLDEPRNQVQRWIEEGWVRLDGRAAKPATRVAAGASVECDPEPPSPDPDLTPEPGPLKVLFEDAWLVAVDKPPGLTVHPGAGRPTGTLVHRLLARYPEMATVGGRGRPGIVHRLDKDTSGVLVVARTPAAYRFLQRAFASRRVGKRYLAVAHGAPSPSRGTIDRPVGRHPQHRREMTVRPDGRPAESRFRVLAVEGDASLLELELVTGRTHQIRVHLKSIGHPLVGDPVYGEARWKAALPRQRGPLRRFPRPALHAWKLRLEHPGTGASLEVVAPAPEDLAALWEALGGGSLPTLLTSR